MQHLSPGYRLLKRVNRVLYHFHVVTMSTNSFIIFGSHNSQHILKCVEHYPDSKLSYSCHCLFTIIASFLYLQISSYVIL